ncbi:MAG: hypothetical protein HOW97_05495 [Catenulispora sp.]|nr:hypothetical protein [Catenulispora sp.]
MGTVAQHEGAARNDAAPDGVDIERPSAARLYDWLLGGHHNFAPDRALGRRLLRAEPNARMIVRENREFLGRAVRFLLEQGVRQFLDLGSGIPTQENVHQIAQRSAPGTRVVYVDNDASVVAHGRHILRGDPGAAAIQADMRRPDLVLNHPTTQELLDFSQPIGLLMVTVLHFIPDEDEPYAMVAHYRDAVPPGSFVAISHATHEAAPSAAAKVEQLYRSAARTAAHTRSHEEIVRLFAGFDIVEPGVVYLPLWRPDAAPAVKPEEAWFYAGVGRLDRR